MRLIKLKGLQFHLSTGIVMMCAAGPILWGNLRVRKSIEIAVGTSGKSLSLYMRDLCCEYGWPLTFHTATHALPNLRVYHNSGEHIVEDPEEEKRVLNSPSHFDGERIWKGLLIDFFIGCLIIIGIGKAFQIWIRR